jgi:hypothetical protein
MRAAASRRITFLLNGFREIIYKAERQARGGGC